jgi:pimeloyl-ACP methyl ester carboxylesterase
VTTIGDGSRQGNLSRRTLLAVGGFGVVGAAGCRAVAGSSNVVQAGCRESVAALLNVPVPEQAPVREEMIEMPGARLWCWDTGGSGETIVLSHPFTGSGATWVYQQPVFAAAGYRVIGYSRRGHFRSESDAEKFPPASQDLDDLVNALGTRRFHLIGCSAGAAVAADYAISHPEKLNSLVIASGIISLQDKLIADTYPRLVPAGLPALPADFRELGASYRAVNPQGTQLWLELEKDARTVANPVPPSANVVTLDKLASLPIPTLLLSGECDLYMPAGLLLRVAEHMPAAQVAIMRSAGHAASWEQPAVFNRLVLDFMEKSAKRRVVAR